MGSAAIVGKANVAISAAHVFYDKHCKPKDDLSKCFFETIVKPPTRPRRYYVKSIDVGVTCPYGTRDGVDWAVIELQKPVLDVNPYRIANDCTLDEHWSGINVAAAHDSFEESSRHPPTVATCNARGADPVYGTIKTDCPSGGWASGSGLLCEVSRMGQTPAISGILVTRQANPVYDFKPYDPIANFTQVVPISGRFLATLQRHLQD